MTDTGFISQNSADLVTIFEPLGIGSLGPATNFIDKDGNDLNTRFAPFVSGDTSADVTGYTVGTTDLSSLFMKKDNNVEISFHNNRFKCYLDQNLSSSIINVKIEHGTTVDLSYNIDVYTEWTTVYYDLNGNMAYNFTITHPSSPNDYMTSVDISFNSTQVIKDVDYIITFTYGDKIYRSVYVFIQENNTIGTTQYVTPSVTVNNASSITYQYKPNFLVDGVSVNAKMFFYINDKQCKIKNTDSLKTSFSSNSFISNINTTETGSVELSTYYSNFPLQCYIQYRKNNKIYVTDVKSLYTAHAFTNLRFLSPSSFSFETDQTINDNSAIFCDKRTLSAIPKYVNQPPTVNPQTNFNVYTIVLTALFTGDTYKIIWVNGIDIYYCEGVYVGVNTDYYSAGQFPEFYQPENYPYIVSYPYVPSLMGNSFDPVTYSFSSSGVDISCMKIWRMWNIPSTNPQSWYFPKKGITWSGQIPYTMNGDYVNYDVDPNTLIQNSVILTDAIKFIDVIQFTTPPTGIAHVEGSSYFYIVIQYQFRWIYSGFIVVNSSNVVINTYELKYDKYYDIDNNAKYA